MFISPMVPVSWGELLDKITILQIKLDNVDESKRVHVKRELNFLVPLSLPALDDQEVVSLSRALKEVNLQLWKIEDDIREKERRKEFDNFFIELARSVYQLNDKRAALKRMINMQLDSELIEVKSYGMG